MTLAKEDFRFQKETRTPSPRPPAHACDTQFHAYGDPAIYPWHPKRLHDDSQLDASFEAAMKMHQALGIERGVYVQPSAYQTDYRYLIDCLTKYKNYRATALMDDDVSDRQLATLNDVGVRGIRINFRQMMGAIPSTKQFERSAARVAELGWHIKVRVERDEILAYEKLFRTLRSPVLIDHMGLLDYNRGVDQPACRLILDLLKNSNNWWIMLSNADRYTEYPWGTSVAIARAYIEAAPERVVWATDWPHNQYTKPVPNDADLLELQLFEYAPHDDTRRKILVENPARLYDFPL